MIQFYHENLFKTRIVGKKKIENEDKKLLNPRQINNLFKRFILTFKPHVDFVVGMKYYRYYYILLLD
jgi:hypothetical protein